jgi:hypothetical protein
VMICSHIDILNSAIFLMMEDPHFFYRFNKVVMDFSSLNKCISSTCLIVCIFCLTAIDRKSILKYIMINTHVLNSQYFIVSCCHMEMLLLMLHSIK